MMKKALDWLIPDIPEKVFYRRIRIAVISVLSLYVIYIALVVLLFSGCKKEPCYTCFAFSDNGTILLDTDYLCGAAAKYNYQDTWELNSGLADVTTQCYEE